MIWQVFKEVSKLLKNLLGVYWNSSKPKYYVSNKVGYTNVYFYRFAEPRQKSVVNLTKNSRKD